MVLAVRFTTVRHSNDQNHKDFVLDLVDYPVVADPDPVGSICADELLGSVRARIIRKALHGCVHRGYPRAINPPQILLCRSGKLNPV